MIKEFLFKRRLKNEGIELLDIKDRVYRIYKQQVSRNRNLNDHEVYLKLNRNFLLGTTIKNTNRVETRCYGNLKITYSKVENKIVDIWNYRGAEAKYDIDLAERDRLTKLLGIKEVA